MLLRLLPAPTAAQANPPTILFTLPAPNQPYTARALPLPSNLLAHRSVCLQEDIECPNVLLGDKASWISGVIDDVTFSLVSQLVTVNFVDGTQKAYPVNSSCASMLHRVCHEVELSFAPSAAITPTPESTPSHSRQSSAANSIASSSRRSTSSMLFSLLSPLLPGTASPAVARIPPARIHRRQARSLLVDTFRRFVLPTLKAELPSAYLPWSVASETKRRMADFDGLRSEVNRILAETGVEKGTRAPLRRYRTFSSGSESDDDASGSECASTSSTPATSVCSSAAEDSPQSFLLSIPPAHAIPVTHQHTYTVLLQRLTHIASRLHSITRLASRYEKEESKRVWLESLERGRAADKSLRRAWSNGELKKGVAAPGQPTEKSSLWRSISAEDVEREERRLSVHVHPAMMDDEPELSSDEDGDSADEAPSPLTPIAPIFSQVGLTIRLPTSSSLDVCYEAEIEGEDMALEYGAKDSRRPSLSRTPSLLSSDDEEDLDADTSLPSLYASSSTESLSSGDWDEEVRTPSPTPPSESDSDEEMQLHTAGILPSPRSKGFNWTPYPIHPTDKIGSLDVERPKSRLAHRRSASDLVSA